jgi:ABC-type glycerol-3-phosphate transport system permease component
MSSADLAPRRTAGRASRLPRLLLVYPFLIAVAAAVLYPVVWMTYSAFKPDGAILKSVFSLPTSFYLENFSRVFNSGMDTWVYNSLFVTAASVAGVLVLSAAAAYAFSVMSFRGRDALFTFMLVGLMVPPQAIVIAGFKWMSVLHLVDTYYPLVYMQSETHYTIPIGVLQFQSRAGIQYGTQMAGLVVATAVPLVVYLLFRRQFVRGIFEGALKG